MHREWLRTSYSRTRYIPVTTALSFLPGALANALIISAVPFPRSASHTPVSWQAAASHRGVTDHPPGVSHRSLTSISPANTPGSGKSLGSPAVPLACASPAMAIPAAAVAVEDAGIAAVVPVLTSAAPAARPRRTASAPPLDALSVAVAAFTAAWLIAAFALPALSVQSGYRCKTSSEVDDRRPTHLDRVGSGRNTAVLQTRINGNRLYRHRGRDGDWTVVLG
jgi:hypothetical protein